MSVRKSKELNALLLTEGEIDEAAVDAFAWEMRRALAANRAKGKTGWHDKDRCDDAWLSELFYASVAGGNLVNIANFAMMLHQRAEQLSPATDPLRALLNATVIIERKYAPIDRVRCNSADPDLRGYAAEFIQDSDEFLAAGKSLIAEIRKKKLLAEATNDAATPNVHTQHQADPAEDKS